MNAHVYGVLTVGGSGGDITLYGCRFQEKSYYLLRTSEAALCGMIEEYENSEINNLFQQTTDHVEGWELGAELLERYSWRRLYPVYLNPTYKERILASYLKKSPNLSGHWRRFIGRDQH